MVTLQQMQANLTMVSINGLDVYFSYTTPVAFRRNGTALVVSENVWSQTTGKHLSVIDGGDKAAKAKRIPSETFTAMLATLR